MTNIMIKRWYLMWCQVMFQEQLLIVDSIDSFKQLLWLIIIIIMTYYYYYELLLWNNNIYLIKFIY